MGLISRVSSRTYRKNMESGTTDVKVNKLKRSISKDDENVVDKTRRIEFVTGKDQENVDQNVTDSKQSEFEQNSSKISEDNSLHKDENEENDRETLNQAINQCLNSQDSQENDESDSDSDD